MEYFFAKDQMTLKNRILKVTKNQMKNMLVKSKMVYLVERGYPLIQNGESILVNGKILLKMDVF